MYVILQNKLELFWADMDFPMAVGHYLRPASIALPKN